MSIQHQLDVAGRQVVIGDVVRIPSGSPGGPSLMKVSRFESGMCVFEHDGGTTKVLSEYVELRRGEDSGEHLHHTILA